MYNIEAKKPYMHYIDPCDPNPCLNGGTCDLTPAGHTHCNCPLGYTGLFCATPTQFTCPGDLCTSFETPFVRVLRSEDGDRVTVPEPSEQFCSAINSHCVGRNGQCEACQCNPGTSYDYQTSSCVSFDEGECLIQR